MRKLAFVAAAVTAILGAIATAPAQVYPSRPITMFVSFAAGGAADTVARILIDGMRAPLGQSIIIENVTGAGGSIGVGRAARAAADGYTLCFGSWATHVVNGVFYTLSYDLMNDFEPVALLTAQPLLVIARKTIPAKDLNELIAWLRANPDKASMGSAGNGSASHIASIFFQKETGTQFAHVPYRGGALVIQDLVAGQIDMMIGPAADFLPQVRAGTVKAYAVTAENRLAVAPDIPTVDEAGLPGLHISLWNGLWVPKKTPKDIVGRLAAAVADALANPAVRAKLADLGQEVPPRQQQTPEALAAYHKAEIDKWWPILKAANIKAR